MSKRFFSLVELLIVVSILVILISLLTPSLKKMIAQVESLKCMNNFKTIGAANAAYLNDFNGVFVSRYYGSNDVSYFLGRGASGVSNPTGIWYRTLSIGYKSIYDHLYINNWDTFLCPSIKQDYLQIAASNTWNPTVYLARLRAGAARMNLSIFSKDQKGYSLNDVQGVTTASEVIFAMDSQSCRMEQNGERNFGFFSYKLGRKMYEISIRHDFRTSAIFLDGHAESISAVDLYNNPHYLAVDPKNVPAFKRYSLWNDLNGFTYE